MKTKKLELDVDFIGEQNSLTSEEEKALSDFFKQKKIERRIEVNTVRKSRSKKTSSN